MLDILFGILIFGIVVVIVIAPFYFVFYRHHRVTLTETGIKAPQGMLSLITYEIPYSAIKTVNLSQDFLSYDWMFSKLQISTQDRTFTFRGYGQGEAYKLAQSIQSKIPSNS